MSHCATPTTRERRRRRCYYSQIIVSVMTAAIMFRKSSVNAFSSITAARRSWNAGSNTATSWTFVPTLQSSGPGSSFSNTFGLILRQKISAMRMSSNAWLGEDDIKVDPSGRKIRSRSGNDEERTTTRRTYQQEDNGGWDDFDPWNSSHNQKRNNSSDRNREDKQSMRQPTRRPQRNYDDDDRRGQRPDRRRDQSFSSARSSFRPSSRSDRGNNRNNIGIRNEPTDKTTRSINLNALEGAGFVHLYGLSSVLNALSANRRDFQTNKENTELGLADYDDRFSELSPSNFDGKYFADDVESDKVKTGSDESKHEVKPQAMFRPYLFVQERSNQSGRRGSKASAAAEIIKLAQERDIPVEYVDKGILNTLSGNRPHQGFILRCGKLTFKSLSRIPAPNPDDRNDKPSIWLVLDEIVDPQNLGALLRSAYFLGGGSRGSLGVLVCSKNSAPPSPIVSSASAGALELLDVFSTNNLPRTLSQACEDGFRVIGASSSVPTQQISNFERRQTSDDDDSDGADYDNSLETGLSLSSTPILYDLQDLPIRLPDKDGNDRPILLVLGSEGQGLRNLVAKACTEFVRIPPGFASSIQAENGDNNEESDETEAGVDSLNVSVSAGIMLWHLLSGSK